jgi:hypothetical protein
MIVFIESSKDRRMSSTSKKIREAMVMQIGKKGEGRELTKFVVLRLAESAEMSTSCLFNVYGAVNRVRESIRFSFVLEYGEKSEI